MHIQDWLHSKGKNQGDLAQIIKRGKTVTARDRVRAHRIYHGAMPNDIEMKKIFADTLGDVDANDFYKLRAIHRPSHKGNGAAVNAEI